MKLFLLMISLLCGIISAKEPHVKTYTSEARNLENNKIIYKEFHKEKYSGGRIKVSVTKYNDLNNNPISERIMKFNDDLIKPNFILEDLTSGYIEGADVIGENKVKVFTRKDSNSKIEEEVLTVEEPYVIDGGLTYFFIKHWDSLINGQTEEFNFITPSKLDYFRFRVYKDSIVTIGGRKGMQLILEPNSFFIRAFVDPIIIVYALDNKEILYYKGISNVNDENGNSYSVEINFTDNFR